MEKRTGTVLFFSEHKGYGLVSSKGGTFIFTLANVKRSSRLPHRADVISFDFTTNKGHYIIENIEVCL